MQYNLINGRSGAKLQTGHFLGLNRTENTAEGEFASMLNLSSDRYPCLSAACSRAKVQGIGFNSDIRAVIAPKYTDDETVTTFTGVAGNAFFYNSEAYDDVEIPEGDVTLVDFNGKIIICVYNGAESTMLYFDYTASGADDNNERHVKPMEKGFTSGIECSAYSSGNPEKDVDTVNYLQLPTSVNVSWTEYFKEGDAVFIDGFANVENNTVDIDSRFRSVDKSRAVSCVVERIDGRRLYLQRRNYLGETVMFTSELSQEVRVYIKIPTMNHVCVHNNRLWGTNPNGEYVYASKLGDCFNFSTYQGLANDSYYANVGTAGGFVGIVSYRDNLVAFKRDYIHHIYGDKPSNFTIPKQLSDCGCIDIRSVEQVGSALYYLGYNGFYVYVGGQPELISEKLGRRYTRAVGMTDGVKYIVSAATALGEVEFLVYDARYGLWHAESPMEAIGSFHWHDKLYIADASELYRYKGKAAESWSCESVIMYEGIYDNKGINELWIRAKIDEGKTVTVFTSEDGGEMLRRETLTGTGEMKVYRVPVRFISGEYYQYRIEGDGNACIYGIERVAAVGGREYGRKR